MCRKNYRLQTASPTRRRSPGRLNASPADFKPTSMMQSDERREEEVKGFRGTEFYVSDLCRAFLSPFRRV